MAEKYADVMSTDELVERLRSSNAVPAP